MKREHEVIKQLSQSLVDLSILLFPISGLAMAGYGIQAKTAVKEFGIDSECKPSDHVMEAQFDYNSRITAPFRDELDQIEKALEGLEGFLIEPIKNDGHESESKRRVIEIQSEDISRLCGYGNSFISSLLETSRVYKRHLDEIDKD